LAAAERRGASGVPGQGRHHELLGAGAANPKIGHHAGYDYFAVWRLPSPEVVEAFEQGIEDDGWYEYFEQVNASGESVGLEALMGRAIAP
jgi:hypothetical protein